MKNIRITDHTDNQLAQGESLLKYWLIAFVGIAWICRNDLPIETHKDEEVNILRSIGIL